MKTRLTDTTYKTEYWSGVLGHRYGIDPAQVTTIQGGFTDDLIYSQGNRYRRLGKERTRIGGDFLVTRRNYFEGSTLGTGPTLFERTNGTDAYKAPQYANDAVITQSKFPVVVPSSDATLHALGRFAISCTAPTIPKVSLSAFLGELHEGLPKAVGLAQNGKAQAAVGSKAGSEYLNVQFGWVPFVKDIRNFADAATNAQRIYDEYGKHDRKLLKRSYTWPVEETSTVVEGSGGVLPVPNQSDSWMWLSGGKRRKHTVIRKERWFEAAYMYFLPPAGTARDYAKANHVFGTDITPATIYQLTPWSWAADWITDSGVQAKNIAAFQTDGLVMPYAYVMERITSEVTWTLTDVQYDYTRLRGSKFRQKHSFSQTFQTVTKKRVAASPYGFGLSWDGFTPKQLAILGALGITR
jgi:hypothetical protein